MSDKKQETGFSFPPEEVLIETRVVIAVLAIIPVFVGLVSGFSSGIFIMLASIATALGFLYWHINTYKIIYLSPHGMRGQGRYGQDVRIGWDAPVVIGSDLFRQLPAISIRKRDTILMANTLVFPWVIAQQPEFQGLLQQFAPPDHALLAAVNERKSIDWQEE